MVFDPIFQGLAISLMAGAAMSTVLTLVVIPLAYFLYARQRKNRFSDAVAGIGSDSIAPESSVDGSRQA